jgi:ankyrin repeat protein
MLASNFGYTEIIKLFLAHPTIDVNIQNRYRTTALILASRVLCIDAVTLLLAHPTINVNLQNESGSTALISVSAYCNTPLLRECFEKQIKIVELLLAHPAINVDLTDKDGKTALEQASGCGFIEIVQLIASKLATLS